MNEILALLLSTAMFGIPVPVCDTERAEAFGPRHPASEAPATTSEVDANILGSSQNPGTALAGPPRPQRKGFRKVAVLIASEWTLADKNEFRKAYWYDTVLAYCALRHRGFDDDEIYVLYGHGIDGGTRWGAATGDQYVSPEYCGEANLNRPITDYPMSVPIVRGAPSVAACNADQGQWRCAPKAIFDCLAEGCANPRKSFSCATCPAGPIRALNENDFLLVWWRGHARGGDSPPKSFEFNVGLDWIQAKELESWTDRINAGLQAFVFETCQSGCLTSAFNGRTQGSNYVSPAIVVGPANAARRRGSTSFTT